MNLMGLLGYVRFTVVDSRAGNVCQACTDTIRLGNFNWAYYNFLATKLLLVNFSSRTKPKRRE